MHEYPPLKIVSIENNWWKNNNEVVTSNDQKLDKSTETNNSPAESLPKIHKIEESSRKFNVISICKFRVPPNSLFCINI